ncbi:zinc finger protein 600-like [Chrysoperla carnea]|uniref:zinc finger protein 600-like n=1 Tax=Chrysoperla carnea TaxID=189513 RepID=UPI001D06EF28|nr:zinc finger protein 600-like [Chrysoperla carnea]
METEQLLNFEDRLKIFNNLLPEKSNSLSKRRIFTKIPKFDKTEPDLNNYICDLCGKSFEREIQYYGHLQKHSGERNWKCEKCLENNTFRTQSQLREHEKQFHFQIREYKCSEEGCNKSYSRPSRLDYHNRRVHLNERNFDCKICDKRFFTGTDLKAHLNVHLGTNKKICEKCGQSFHHISNFLRHIRKHDGIKPYQCEKCDKRFSEITILRKHMLFHDKSYKDTKEPSNNGNDRKFYCYVCGKTFQYLQDVRQHEIIHEKDQNISCKSCLKSFSTIKEIKLHNCFLENSNNKNNESSDDREENSSLNLTSDWTQIMNGLLSQLDIDLETKHQNDLSDNFEDNTLILSPLKSINSSMDLTQMNLNNQLNELSDYQTERTELEINTDTDYSSENKLKSPLKNLVDIKDDFLKQNVCKICGAVFAHNSSMYRHLRNHSSNFVNCDYCDKKLTADSLYTHIRRVHKQEKNFVCSFTNCGKVFFKQADLVIHKRSHTKERPYKCRHCSKSFISSSHQLRHEKTHKKTV